MHTAFLVIATLSATLAQEAGLDRPEVPTPSALLKEAEAVSGGFSAEERVYLLLQLASAMKRVDKGLAESWARQVFVTTTSLPPGHLRSASQKNALVVLADLNPGAAAELFKQQDPSPKSLQSEDIRTYGTRALFPNLWAAQKMAAIPVIEDISQWLGSGGSYPYTAMTEVIVNVAQTDPERARSLFTQAIGYLDGDTYLSTPEWYVDFLFGTSKVIVGPQMVDAINAGLKSIERLAKRPDAPKKRLELSTGKSTVRIESEAEALVYRLLPLMASYDRDWPKRLMERYPNLSQLPSVALEASVQTSGAVFDSKSDSEAIQVAMDESKLDQLQSMAVNNPGTAWTAAFQITNPEVRAIALATLAPRHAEEDPKDAASWLGKLDKIADSLKTGSRKLRLWSQMSTAYFSLQREQDAERFMSRAFDLGQELFAQARRETPGVMTYRLAGFDELVTLSETAGARSGKVANVVARVRQIGQPELEAHMLAHLAEGLSTQTSQAKALPPKGSLP